MNVNDLNVLPLEAVAERLGDTLREELVFVGGAVAGLLITDPAMPDIRPTYDVDLICKAVARIDYYKVEASLRERGFMQDMSPDAPICRWRVGSGAAAVAVDVMPTLEDILGFSNRWYPLALESAQQSQLPSGRTIRLIAAPVFVATKLEAFAERGKGDFVLSHDLEDLLAIVDGRDLLVSECRASPLDLRAYLEERFRLLLSTPAFVDALSEHLPGDPSSQQRLPQLLENLRLIADLRAH